MGEVETPMPFLFPETIIITLSLGVVGMFFKLVMGKGVVINGLNSVDVEKLYIYVCEYAANIEGNPGSFDITNPTLCELLKKHDIYLDSFNKTNVAKTKRHVNYILFEQYVKSKASRNDKAHHLLRHLRNSIAHGLIKKIKTKNIEYYELADKNEKRGTMMGTIKVQVFYSLIENLINSNKTRVKRFSF